MSWDVILTKTNNCTNNKGEKSNYDTSHISKFDSSKVVSVLKSELPEINLVDDYWLNYEGGLFALSFNLFDEQEIMVHIHSLDESEDSVIAIILKLCELLNCQAFDTTTGEYLGNKV